MTDALLGALALMLVFEGLFPLIHPRGWRDVFQRLLCMNDGQIRFFGLISVCLGAWLFWLWH